MHYVHEVISSGEVEVLKILTQRNHVDAVMMKLKLNFRWRF